MSRTYRQAASDDAADFKQLVRSAASRRAARKLAQLAWGDAAIADQDYRDQLASRIHA